MGRRLVTIASRLSAKVENMYRLYTKLMNSSDIRHIYTSPPGATQHIVGVYFTALYRALASSRTRLLDHIQRRTTVGRTPLNE